MSDVVLRELWDGRVWRAVACRIVEEGAERIVLWLPQGASVKLPVDGDGAELRIPGGDWRLADRPARRDALALFRPGGRHSIWLFRNADGALAYWYVNFEQPLRRTIVGFDYFDEKLDLVVEPNGRWRWKDEDELAEAARRGIVDADDVRAEAARVLSDPPWPTGWEDWRPDRTWPTPQLPEGWHIV